jgi:hypothetical protein
MFVNVRFMCNVDVGMGEEEAEGRRGRGLDVLLFTSSHALREQAAAQLGGSPGDRRYGGKWAKHGHVLLHLKVIGSAILHAHLSPNCAREQAVISRVHSHAYPGAKRLTSVESHWVIGQQLISATSVTNEGRCRRCSEITNRRGECRPSLGEIIPSNRGVDVIDVVQSQHAGWRGELER